MSNKFRKNDWDVRPCSLSEARQLIAEYHYAKGGSNTAVYTHGLYPRRSDIIHGVAWWLPPTRVAAESVDSDWTKVLSLTRMVVVPGVPKNAVSFLLAGSIRIIKNDGRFHSLVTYADEWAGHTGLCYRASNWVYVGRTGPYPKWIDKDGRQVAVKSTTSRTKQQMIDLGHTCLGSFYKHKYVFSLKDWGHA